MTKSRMTRKALLISVMAVALCLVMLTGTSFAWFTDQETSANNKIIAGNLDVELLMFNGTDYVNIGSSNKPIFGGDDALIAQNDNLNTLWEPGKTQVAFLAIKNSGNLALKYNVEVNVIDNGLVGVLEYAILDNVKANDIVLSDYSWTTVKALAGANAGFLAAGKTMAAENGCLDEIRNGEGFKDETDYFALAIHMSEEAGNNYMSTENAIKSVVIDIIVNATQVEAEEDSFDATYDKYSDYESVVTVPTAGDVAGAFDMTKDVVAILPQGETDVPMISLNGTGESSSSFIIDGAKTTFTGNLEVNSHANLRLGDDAVLTIDGITVDGTLKVVAYYKNVVIKNVKADAIEVNSNGNVTVENCVIDGSGNNGIYVVGATEGYSFTAKNNVIVNAKKNGIQISGCATGATYGAGTITVSGNTFENWCTINDKPRAAFKIWGDANLAPEDITATGAVNAAATALIDEIRANNTFVSSSVNQPLFDIYGYTFN